MGPVGSAFASRLDSEETSVCFGELDFEDTAMSVVFACACADEPDGTEPDCKPPTDKPSRGPAEPDLANAEPSAPFDLNATPSADREAAVLEPGDDSSLSDRGEADGNPLDRLAGAPAGELFESADVAPLRAGAGSASNFSGGCTRAFTDAGGSASKRITVRFTSSRLS
jgi:hypothetical protein